MLWPKYRPLDADVRERLGEYREIVANPQKVPVIWDNGKYEMEYIHIPPFEPISNRAVPFVNFPALTNAFWPLEPFMFLPWSESYTFSPGGYGGSSDFPWRFYVDIWNSVDISLQAMKKTGIDDAILYAHAAAGPQAGGVAVKAGNYGINIKALILVATSGLHTWLNPAWIALKHGVSGALTRLLSSRTEHPLKFLAEDYRAPKHGFSPAKLAFELYKASRGLLPEMLRQIKCPIIAIFPLSDFAQPRRPLFRKSSVEILKECVPENQLLIRYMPGLVNVTLGKDSPVLAQLIDESLKEFDL